MAIIAALWGNSTLIQAARSASTSRKTWVMLPLLGEVRTGVEAKVNNNLSLWGNVGVQLGDKGYSDTQGMLGVKYSW
ncbi:autotransporter outer membrane beta-barrel domain-containing protein [Escherichia coli]